MGDPLYDAGVAPETMWIKLNTGETVERPYREAVRLLSRRLADPAEDPGTTTVPLDQENADPEAARVKAEGAEALAEKFTKAELVEIAEKNDLPTSGTKPELVERLLAANVELSATVQVGATPGNVPEETKASTSDGRD